MRKATWSTIFVLMSLGLTFFAYGESTDLTALRLSGLSGDPTAAACALGDAARCLQRRIEVDRLPIGKRDAIAAVGGGGGAPARTDAQEAQSVDSWASKAMNKIQGLRDSGALNVLGMFGGQALVGKVENILGTIQSNHGDIKTALQSGGLLGMVQDALGAAKQVIVADHLGDGSRIDQLSSQLAQTAQGITSGQVSVQGAIAQLTQQYGNDPLVKNLESAFGGISASSSGGDLARAAGSLLGH